jgi:ribosomal protein S27E
MAGLQGGSVLSHKSVVRLSWGPEYPGGVLSGPQYCPRCVLNAPMIYICMTQDTKSEERGEIMKVKCVSCGREINLDHRIFDDYAGPVKCFSCSSMMEVKTAEGVPYSINLLDIFENRAAQATLLKEGPTENGVFPPPLEGEAE